MFNELKKIIILGGGTAGWMTAAACAKFLPENYQVVLVESEQIGTVGVGEATIPHIRYFNNMLGIEERAFLSAVKATYKLGIQFIDWGSLGAAYIHPFGSHGYPVGSIDFHHYWLSAMASGVAPAFDQFSLAVVMAEKKRFAFPETNAINGKNAFSYAYHIDAGRYAKFLRKYAEERNVVRIEGRLSHVMTDATSGAISSLQMDSGATVEGDFFIDCSGFRAILLAEKLSVPFDDWSNWLLCDRAVAVPCERVEPPKPYTVAHAKPWGWRWRIPLQHRTGNGMVYSSSAITDEDALQNLLTNLDGYPLADPNFLKFTAGRRKKNWEKNCIAIGLSSGFLEPLESTSIYLIQQGILKFLEYFPGTGDLSTLRDAYNKEMETEYVRIRDFLILHYKITKRNDSEFWRYCQNMALPESLERSIELFRATGHVERYQNGLFMSPSWLAVYLGQGVGKVNFDTRVLNYPDAFVLGEMQKMREKLELQVQAMPMTNDVLEAELSATGINQQPVAASLYGVV
ncbi:tryptophan halogenase family protein [Cellvibrio fibrivorans]|uniref:Tryptophan halogenase n=1 Tax=Cellvibrio fibrivorans TaxID=126350 RepID=A0ABU1UZ59_9GAMM|nr:tryptophan 7-halogenase [Cellvibrio fibrivorans]MDR7090397.1 tryptophan halogenase [Cellvibrio fibrivorans]